MRTRLRAKHAGICRACGEKIVKGQQVYWQGKGSGAVHVHCPGAPWFLDSLRQKGYELLVSVHALRDNRQCYNACVELLIVDGDGAMEIEPGVYELRKFGLVTRAWLDERVVTVRSEFEYAARGWPDRLMTWLMRLISCPTGIPGSAGRYRLEGDVP